ncbi:MAG: recombinase family protein [Limisphaerales bacterium]
MSVHRKAKQVKNAYSYIRFSTPMQARGNSYSRQMAASRQYAKEKGFYLVEDLKLFDKGISAKDGRNRTHGALGIFLDKVRAGEIQKESALLVESLDRLSREQLLKQLRQFLEIIELGIEIHTIHDRMVYTEESVNREPHQLHISLISMARGREETKIKMDRVAAAWKAKRELAKKHKTPMSAMVPYWMALNKATGKIELITERAQVVRQIFNWAMNEKHGKRWICRELNRQNTPTWRGGKGWEETFVARILNNPACWGAHLSYAAKKMSGYYDANADLIEDYYPPVVKKEDFYRLRAIRAAAAPGRKASTDRLTNLFPTLLWDGEYNVKMAVIRKAGDDLDPLRWTYLVSDIHRIAPDTKRTRTNLAYKLFERVVLEFLWELNWDRLTTKDNQTPLAKLVAAKKAEAIEMQKRLTRLLDMVENDGPQADLMARIKDRRKELDVLQSEITKITTQQENQFYIGSGDYSAAEKRLQALYQKGDYETRCQLKEELNRLIARIDIYARGVTGLKLIQGFEHLPTVKITLRAGTVLWFVYDFDGLQARIDELDEANLYAVQPTCKLKPEVAPAEGHRPPNLAQISGHSRRGKRPAK